MPKSCQTVFFIELKVQKKWQKINLKVSKFGSKWLQMDPKDSKWLEMAQNGSKSVKPLQKTEKGPKQCPKVKKKNR